MTCMADQNDGRDETTGREKLKMQGMKLRVTSYIHQNLQFIHSLLMITSNWPADEIPKFERCRVTWMSSNVALFSYPSCV